MNPELEAAIRAVEALAGRRATLTRHDARPILLGIGRALLAGRTDEVAYAADRLRRLPPQIREIWVAAVQDEMSMASTEHVRSVDPRYLDHPRYDLEYTRVARRELEARRRACEHLGLRTDPALAASVARSDEVLERHLGKTLSEWISERREGDPE